MKSKIALLAGTAFLALAAPAYADNIDTIPQWNGVTFISSYGIPNTATYGQTFTPSATQSRLNSFTVEIGFASAPIASQAFVYQWDSVNNRIVGPALFSSGTINVATGAGFAAVTVNTGSVALTPGQQYVVFLSTSNLQTGAPNSSSRWGALPSNTPIPNGQFVFQNNTANFGQLSTNPWSTIAEDLAITLQLNGFLSPLLPAKAPINPTNVAAAVDKALAAGLALPPGFNNLFLLTPAQLVDALGQVAGEVHTQAQTGAFVLGNQYLSLLTDPFATNRVTTTGTLNYGPEERPKITSNLPPAIASAYGAYMKVPPAVYQPRWDVWGAAFGGSANLSGDLTTVGSHNTYTGVGAVAAGADYRFSPNSLIGFSLAGGATNWSVGGSTGGNAFGSGGAGHSDVFMAAGYGKYSNGPAYVSGAVSYSNYWMNTNRTVTVAGFDQLNARFGAESWGGRLEGGWKLPNPIFKMNWTPYAAIQGQSFRTGNYAETALVGSNQFALNFTGRTATAYREEVGLRNDLVVPIDKGSQLDLFGKIAYAHDDITNPSANANLTAFGVGGAPFIVYGALPARNLALSTTGMEARLANGWSFMAKVDTEYGDRDYRSYSGTGRIRYTW
jgi:hypothetical protein